jgi:hypothetical protein
LFKKQDKYGDIMEKRVVSNYIKDFVSENFDKIEGLSGDHTEEFIKKFNEVVDENEDENYFRMLEIRKEINKEMSDLGDKIKCDVDDFEDFLKNYSAIFLISKKYFYISYIGIFNDEDSDYPKFDKETYSQFSSAVYIPM